MIGTGSGLVHPPAAENPFPTRLIENLLYLIETVRGGGAINPQILRRSSRGRFGKRVKLRSGDSSSMVVLSSEEYPILREADFWRRYKSLLGLLSVVMDGVVEGSRIEVKGRRLNLVRT